MKKDISSIEDIRLMVNTFYDKVQQNELIGPIFSEKIDGRWPDHLEKMYKFWQTVLLEEHTYNGRPFPPHAQLPVYQEHFDTWMTIFKSTLNELFEGPVADDALYRASLMAKMFMSKIDYFRGHSGKTML